MLDNYIKKDVLSSIDNINILELGSGTSLPSLACLMYSNKIVSVITDINKTYDLRSKIIEINKKNFKGKYLNLNLDWQRYEDKINVIDKFKTLAIESIKNNNNKCNGWEYYFNYIICSELIYIDELFDSLINTLVFFSSKNKTKVILTYRERLPEQVKLFLDKFSKYFVYNFYYEDNKELKKFEYKKKMYVIEASLK